MKSFKAAATAGALGIALAACTTSPPAAEQPPASTAASAAAAATGTATRSPGAEPAAVPVDVTRQPADGTPTLDPGGFGAIRLGMAEQQLIDTGLVYAERGPASDGACTLYRLKSGDGWVWYEKEGQGVSSIGLERNVRTPEGITLGATSAELQAAYPNFVDGVNWDNVDLGGGNRYGFTGSPVATIMVVRWEQVCHT